MLYLVDWCFSVYVREGKAPGDNDAETGEFRGVDLNPAEVQPAVIYDDATAAGARRWEFVPADEKEALAARRRARNVLRKRVGVWWMVLRGADAEAVEYLKRWLPTVQLSLGCKVLLAVHSFYVLGFCVGALGLDTSPRMDQVSVLLHGCTAAAAYAWSW